MTVPVHVKKKQSIALGRYIEDSINIAEIKPCSLCVSLLHKYVFDRNLSDYYSEYYCRHVSCDGFSDE
jgi:hypothetical protein